MNKFEEVINHISKPNIKIHLKIAAVIYVFIICLIFLDTRKALLMFFAGIALLTAAPVLLAFFIKISSGKLIKNESVKNIIKVLNAIYTMLSITYYIFIFSILTANSMLLIKF